MEYKDLTDKELVKNVKNNNDENSLKELVIRHSGICLKVYNSYGPNIVASGYFIEDLYKEKDCLIYNCALKYDESKNCKFSTFLGNYARYEALNLINSNKYQFQEIDEATYKIDFSAQSDDFKNKETYEYVENLLDQMHDKRIKDVFEMRYFNKLNLDTDKKPTWEVIGKELDVTPQTAINLHNRGLKTLRQKLTSRENFDLV